jgi:hypothetical protein
MPKLFDGLSASQRPVRQHRQPRSAHLMAQFSLSAPEPALRMCLIPSGEIIVSGRVKHVGVGGFFLGGGLAYFSSKQVSMDSKE